MQNLADSRKAKYERVARKEEDNKKHSMDFLHFS